MFLKLPCVVLSKANTIFEERTASPKSKVLLETLVNPEGNGLEYNTFVSACSIGDSRVFWVVAHENKRPHAFGESASFQDAEKAVLLSLKNRRALCLNSNFAWQEYVEQRLEEAVKGKGESEFAEAAKLQFVYEKYGRVMYQIKRITTTEVIVYSERYTDKFTPDANAATFRLNKRDLDNAGECKSHGRVFCTQEKKEKWDQFRKIPGYLKIFGLDWDANISQVKYWFRKLSMEYHPDKGGSADKFKELVQSYNKAVKALTERDVRDFG